jgi:hypothetical protein
MNIVVENECSVSAARSIAVPGTASSVVAKYCYVLPVESSVFYKCANSMKIVIYIRSWQLVLILRNKHHLVQVGHLISTSKQSEQAVLFHQSRGGILN